ncbi:ribosome biogenesis protein WDR12 [Acrasis kona]|uniref:Ribosome biogenesis protein WDR12 n=1 Tax=Acrasis kona TaxID=1008807 RepID=A0AAW2ZLH1_9EUKA
MSDTEQNIVEEPSTVTNDVSESTEAQPAVTLLNFPSTISVRFVTRNEEQQVTESAINLPSDLTRFGLSEIVNHLLHGEGEENKEKHVPFEFLVEYKETKKAFLRTSLKKFFVKTQKYPESTITIEYVEAQPAPKCVDTIPHDDWVSDIKFDPITNTLFTGCYDKFVRIIDPDSSDPEKRVLATAKHPRPVQNIVCAHSSDGLYFASASKDENARVWKVLKDDNDRINGAECRMILRGHLMNVNDLSVNPSANGELLCTASDDRTIKIWQVDLEHKKPHLFNQELESDEQPTTKKVKRTYKSFNAIGTLGTTSGNKGEGHTLGITCVTWAHKGSIYSGSNDHTIRQWDVARAELTSTISGSKVVSSLTLNQDLNLILTAHPDHLVRMWDPRMSSRASIFRSHKAWVRRVEWQVGGGHQFVSCGDDNQVKVWDVRSALPLHSVSHSSEQSLHQSGRKNVSPFKVLSISYCDNETIYSGSTDTTLKKHKIKN